ncbi:tetratricopeptide repeat protein [Haloimpatiens sp. FM7330]|uniref:tetratricopeptide repeat protein n=1 Tax=Haloimpatiens sp. FM7330 TaxID=3298610 RepID=UPI0036439104
MSLNDEISKGDKMDKSSKLYKKAVKLYNSGYIDKAIEICDKSINVNRRNRAALNFKGLMHYFKGDLNAAQRVWEINYKYNKDEISKKYLKDSKNDEEKFNIYSEAVKLYEAINVNESLKLFQRCEISDYNCININNYIAMCYVKKGEYNKCITYLNKVLKIDKNNLMANNTKSKLKEYGIIKNKNNYKKVIVGIIVIGLILGICYVYKNISSSKVKNYVNSEKVKDKKDKYKNNTNKHAYDVSENNKKVNDKLTNKKAVNNIKTKEQKSDVKFSANLVKQYIENEEFIKLYNSLISCNKEELSINDRLIYEKGINFMKESGVNYFYEKGREYLQKENYNEAKENLLRGFRFSDGSFLKSHIVYFLGITFEKQEDVSNAIKYYEIYEKSYSKGDYAEETLYKLALLSVYKNKEDAKMYANKLKKNYPESIYNNSKMKEIINN